MVMDWGVRRRVNLADELRRWRLGRGLSYRAVADLVRCEHSLLWKIEHGRAVLTREMAQACDEALDAGGALIAAWVAAQGSVRPAQLPVAPWLVSRDAELRALQPGAQGRPLGVPAVVAIDGPAGVGKTALALRWAHDIAEKYVDGQLYADLRAFAPPGPEVTVDAVLARFLSVMGASAIPSTTAERAGLYRSLVAERKVLVVLDNVADVGDVEQLLPASAHCMVVVTSRRALSSLVPRVGATRVTLQPLAEHDAIALLSRAIGHTRADAEAAAVAAVARLCGYLPMALQIAAEQIATYPRRRVGDLVHGLVEDHRLGELRAVFSWSYHDLEPDAARVFRLLGLHRGPHLSVAAVAALGGLRRPHARRLLHRLASVHLVDIDADDVVRLHDLVRVYARELAATEDADAHRIAATHRLVSWYAAALHAASTHLAGPGGASVDPPSWTNGIEPMVFADDTDAAAWCDIEQGNLGPVTTMARDYGAAGAAHELATRLQDLGLGDLADRGADEPLCQPLQALVPAPRGSHGVGGDRGRRPATPGPLAYAQERRAV